MANNGKKKGGKPKRLTGYVQLSATVEPDLKNKMALYAPGWGKMSGFVEEAIRRELQRREAMALDEADKVSVEDIRNKLDNTDVLIVGQGAEDFVSQAVNYTYHFLRFYSFRAALFGLAPGTFQSYEDSMEQYDVAKREAIVFLGKACNFDEDYLFQLIAGARDAGIEEARELVAAYEKINRPTQGPANEDPHHPNERFAKLWDIFGQPSPLDSVIPASDDPKHR